jgi:mRNA interferase MazF
MTRGKVVLVAFPFDDFSTHKVRPAVCLTEPLTSHRHVVLAFITSREPDEPLSTDLRFETTDPDFGATGLHVASTLRTHRLLTVSSAAIRREIGALSPALWARVAVAIHRLFNLDSPEVAAQP